jgi:hypothetical protein
MCFPEKKNEKTFANCARHFAGRGDTDAARNEQKFFASFFQKRSLP